jgi:hypothetical protein
MKPAERKENKDKTVSKSIFGIHLVTAIRGMAVFFISLKECLYKPIIIKTVSLYSAASYACKSNSKFLNHPKKLILASAGKNLEKAWVICSIT